MLSICRAALVTAAVASCVLFSTPARAGMVATPPVSRDDQHDLAVQVLKAHMQIAGISTEGFESRLASLSTEQARSTTALLESTHYAGNAVIAGVVVVVVAVVTFLVCAKVKKGSGAADVLNSTSPNGTSSPEPARPTPTYDGNLGRDLRNLHDNLHEHVHDDLHKLFK